MVALMIAVAELQGLAVDIDHIDFFRGGKTDVGRFSGSDVTNNTLNESAKVSGCAVVDVENDGWVSVVADRHPFAEIIGCGHIDCVYQ